ncbi:uncharacterized protein LOC110764642 [Prunus avium]|uniref:Uncharacterized protein LOC110764642 n=1 Tax=Prunus avium TaxID=42229 RepID=A0A6P5T7X7_PRUAV|nr:uncharacterized protein LOC110764642 [Prunus avium]
MDLAYTTWVFHGECPSNNVQYEDVEMPVAYRLYHDFYFQNEEFEGYPCESKEAEIENFVREVETPLFLGCTEYTKMSAVVALLKYKATHSHTDNAFDEMLSLTDNAFDEMLQIFVDMLPENNTLPGSLYTTKKIFKAFELGYEKIHACVNDCCLFRNDLEMVEECPKCGSSRWKVNQRNSKIEKGVPAKVLRYFPIVPRLRRMYAITETVEQLRWHSTHKSQDGKMRHPVDSLAWDRINKKWPSFGLDPRNIRFGLCTDGFNPFQDLSSRYSCWPVILVIYNLPPWLCMSKDSLMLTLLIPSPKQPGNDIYIYLAPLIDDLKDLWNNGVKVYDAFSKEMFNLKSVLMWTVNDFPAYGNLSGWSTKGRFACPVCRKDTCADWLTHSHKFSYMGHRRFLAMNHPYRKKMSWFNGHHEDRSRPKISTVSYCNDYYNTILLIDLQNILLRHNLDVMHVEKNICESIIGTLLLTKGKSKDDIKSRKDLENMGIRKYLHPKKTGKRFYLSAAPHTLSKKEKETFCWRLANLKLPDGYGSNIENCISLEDSKIFGHKSHDYHMLMQQLLSVALRGLLPKDPRTAIFRLCAFFNELCQRAVDRNKLEKLEEDIGEREAEKTKESVNRIFPWEEICSHRYVMNRARPEGCMAERYLAKECALLCSRMHLDELRHSNRHLLKNETLLQKKHVESFSTWLDAKIRAEKMVHNVSNTLKWLAREPSRYAISYSGFIINGLWFHTKEFEKSRQNSGVSLEATTICVSSARDHTPVTGKVAYYGVLREVIVLSYHEFYIALFKCDWASIVNGIKLNDGFTLVNLHEGQSQFERDPFILASQAKQVFYSREDETSSWYVVMKAPPKGFQDLEISDEMESGTSTPFDVLELDYDDDDENEQYVRMDVDEMFFDE